MKKIILSVLLGLSIAQVSPVMAAGQAKAGFIKKHKFALGVGIAALALLTVPAYINTNVGDKEAAVNHKDAVRGDKYTVKARAECRKANGDAYSDEEFAALGVLKQEYKTNAEAAENKAPEAALVNCYTKAADVELVPEVVAKNAKPYGAVEKFLWVKVKKTPGEILKMINPWQEGKKEWTAINYKHVAIDAALLAVVVDLGYNLITSKPELAEMIYNKFFGNKAQA